MPVPFKTVALIGKYKSPDIKKPLLDLADFLRKRGVGIVLDELTAKHVNASEYPVLQLEKIGKRADLAIVLGGDGTMLNIARAFAPFDVPLVGVNQGRLGFLTDVSIGTVHETLGTILDGHYVTEQRMLLSAVVYSDSDRVFSTLAFNDVAVAKGIKGSMIEIEVHIDGQFVYTLRSDGLVICTPTGSTAYALSAGGPILHPGLRLIGLVPICPHTLSNRPIVISGDATVEIRMRQAVEARVHCDSHSSFDLKDDDTIKIKRYPNAIRLLHPAGHNYYRMLRQKLHWSETL
ncbi:MAG TPA: NAD kinase [Burkholderiales bacterium]|nr:NAD kinase [Burkholderiales bacterium]